MGLQNAERPSPEDAAVAFVVGPLTANGRPMWADEIRKRAWEVYNAWITERLNP